MNFRQKFGFPAGGALLLWCAVSALAGELVPVSPVMTAESETFEVVGRLAPEGFVLYVDRAASNQAVLGAALEVELAGQSAKARFRAEQGNYVIDDAAWLAGIRQPGPHALALTLVAGAESDLLAAELVMPDGVAGQGEPGVTGSGGWLRPVLLAGVGLAAAWGFVGMRRWRRKGAA